MFYLIQHAKEKLGAVVPRVKGRVRAMKGTFSCGTLASFRETMAAAAKDRDLVNVLRDPFSLTGDFSGPKQPSGNKPEFDEVL